MANFENIKDRIKETIYPNGKGAISAATHQELLLEMVDEIDKKKNDYVPGSAVFSEEGRYPSMSVGFADNLSGHGESIPAEFTFRATGGRSIADGVARIKRIKGNSVVWNQMFPYASDKITTETTRPFRVGTRLVQGHKYAIVGDINVDAYASVSIFARVNGETIFVAGISNNQGEQSAIYTSTMNLVSDGTTLASEGNMWAYYYPSGNGEMTNVRIFDLTLMFGVGNEPTTIEDFYSRIPSGIDLNAYNEGEVIHMTTESIKSVGDNAWDEEWEQGYLNPSNGEESASDSYIRSKNFNLIIGGEEYYLVNSTGGNSSDANMYIVLYDANKDYLDYWGIPESGRTLVIDSRARYFKVTFKAEYGTTYKNDIMITLVHSGWKQDTDAGYQPYWQDIRDTSIIGKYFPTGMKSAGNAYDEIRYNKASQKWEWVCRIGSVDMGTLTWDTLSHINGLFFAEVPGMKMPTTDAENLDGFICGRYGASDSPYVDANNFTDKSMMRYAPYHAIFVRDTAYTDIASFKAAMDGVMLYYELAEPTIREIDEPFNPDYRVADFGTEQAISSRPSAPFAADIIYQFNAVDMIRDLWLKVQELESRL